MTRKLLSLLLIFALLLGLAAPAAVEFHEHDSYYCMGDGVKRSYDRDASGPGWGYTASTRTITLNNFSITETSKDGISWLYDAIYIENPGRDFTVFLAADSVNNARIHEEDVRSATDPGFVPGYALIMNGRGTLNGQISMDCNLKVALCTLNLSAMPLARCLTMESGTINAPGLMVTGRGTSAPLVMNGGAIHIRNTDEYNYHTFYAYLEPHDLRLDTSKFRITGKSGADLALEREEYVDEWSDGAAVFTTEKEFTITAPGTAAASKPAPIDLKHKYDSFELPATFDEDYFSKSSYIYDHDLAWLTLCLELSAFSARINSIWGENGGNAAAIRSANIADSYRQMGFDTVTYHNYDVSLNAAEDKAAFSIAQKKLADGSTLVAAVVRGGGYGAEWASNFHLTESAMKNGYHEGFHTAASEVYKYLTATLSSIDGPIKVWITGYSRGAATANLLAGMLDDFAERVSYLDPEDIYAYTFATPSGVLPAKNPTAAKYQNIFNIVNPGDVVPMVAPAAWGYTRYGTTLSFDASAGYSVFSKVNKAHKEILSNYSTDPLAKFQATLDEFNFNAGRNIRNGVNFAALIGALMKTYPTEDSARGFLNTMRDLMEVTHYCVMEDGEWKKIGLPNIITLLQNQYDAESVNAALAEARQNSTIIDMLSGVFVDNNLFGRLERDAADLAILVYTIGKVNGLELSDMTSLMTNLAVVFRDDSVTELSWKDKLREAVGGSASDVVTGPMENAKQKLSEVAPGHEPLTYLSWMSLDESKIFGSTSWGSGSGSSGGGSSGGGGRDAVPSGWAEQEVKAAIEKALVPTALQKDYRQPVSRAEVSDMFVALIEEVTGLDITEVMTAVGAAVNEGAFSDTQNASVLAMNALGIINGTGGGKFSPDGTLTRAQAAAILNRVARLMGVDTDGYSHSFTDVAGSWVSGELGWPSATGILQGVGDGRFNPNGKLTAEQAILITCRAFEALKK